MHERGLVHGEISYNNIVVLDDRAKILDREHAKLENDWPQTQTTSPCFMSTEVYRQRYQHEPVADSPMTAESTPFDFLDLLELDFNNALKYTRATDIDLHNEGVAPLSLSNTASPDVPFRYNPLHDYESLFWLCLFLLLGASLKEDCRYKANGLSRFTTTQKDLFVRIFSAPFIEKSEIMLESKMFSKLNENLHPTVSLVMTELQGMRTGLVDAFTNAERNMDTQHPIPITVGRRTGRLMVTRVMSIIHHLREDDLEFAVEGAFDLLAMSSPSY